MKLRPITASVIALSITTLQFGCNDIKDRSLKFDKAKWDSTGDLQSHPCREDMLNDLIEHHKIKGLTCSQLVDSLGEPANFGNDKDSIYYEIVVNYGFLDPKSGKYLAIGFNQDSIATGFKVVEWKNRHVNE
jgi:hypothetical protein